MRICLFNNLFPPVPSGSSHFTARLAKGLVERGHAVTVVAAKIPGTAPREVRDGVEVIRLPCRMLPPLRFAHDFRHLSFVLLPGNLRFLSGLCRERAFDVLHQQGQIFDLALVSAHLSRTFRLPLINTIHTPANHTVPAYHALMRFLDRTVVQRAIIAAADTLVAPDETIVTYIHERYRHERVAVVPYGVDPPALSAEAGEAIRARLGLGDAPVVLSVGHVHNLRDRCSLISAFARVLEKVPEATLVIVGQVYSQRPVELVRRLGLESRVLFVGSATHDEIAAYLSAATIEAHWLNSGPGLGIASMEAMAAGLAVISSVGADDFGVGVLRPGENVILIDPASEESIVAGLLALLTNAGLRARIGARARETMREHFSWSSVVSRMEEIYRSACSRSPRARSACTA